MTPETKTALMAALSTMPNRFHGEARLQKAVWQILTAWESPSGHAYNATSEVQLSEKDRIDFLIECADWRLNSSAPSVEFRIGIECKVAGSALSIQRQLYRYARHLPELILLSAKATGIQPGILTAENGNKCLLHVIELWKNPT